MICRQGNGVNHYTEPTSLGKQTDSARRVLLTFWSLMSDTRQKVGGEAGEGLSPKKRQREMAM
jgi:hypothetical protein